MLLQARLRGNRISGTTAIRQTKGSMGSICPAHLTHGHCMATLTTNEFQGEDMPDSASRYRGRPHPQCLS